MVTQINLRYVGRTIQQYINFGKFLAQIWG